MLDAFERQYGVSLPKDYRYFLGSISNGGAGPNYGVKPLSEATIGCDPAAPFPKTPTATHETAGTFDYNKIPGALWLSDNGCATCDNLIVNGQSYGCVWSVLEDRDYCCSESFRDWYVGWFLSAIETIRREPLIRRVKPGMTVGEVREILGLELIPHDPRTSSDKSYWLAFPDCNAYFKFSEADCVVHIEHHSHIIVPRIKY